MKLELISSTHGIALTIAEYNILETLGEWHDEHRQTYWPDTWKFPQSDQIDKIDWNGHSGTYIYFHCNKPGAEQHFLNFIQRLLKINPHYMKGLKDGENGCDLEDDEPSTLSGRMYVSGWTAGNRFGMKNSLTKQYEDYY